MSDPTTNNQAASIINQILKDLIEGTGEASIEAFVISEQPWLGLPVIKQIFEMALSYLGNLFYEQAAQAATSIVVDVQINLEKSATYGAFQNLQLALASGDKQAIDQASKDLDAAYASIIHYDGSASP